MSLQSTLDYYKKKCADLQKKLDEKASYASYDDEDKAVNEHTLADVIGNDTDVLDVLDTNVDANEKADSSNGKLENYLEQYNFMFPIEIFPKEIRKHILDAQNCCCYPTPFYSSSILSAFSTAIGNNYKAVMKTGIESSALLMMVLIAKPGTNKSSPLSAALEPLRIFEQSLLAKYKVELDSYVKLTEDIKKVTAPPTLKRCITSDATMEALIQVLQENPKGVCIYNDEFAGFLKSMNKYRQGDDAEKFLQIWSGNELRVDRLSRTNIVYKPFTSIIGTTQTDVIIDFIHKSHTNNGFYDRLLFVTLDKEYNTKWNEQSLDLELKQAYHKAITALLEIPELYDNDSNIIPRSVIYSKEATDILIAWQHSNADECTYINNDLIRGAYKKLEVYIGRFALIIALMHYAHTCPKYLHNSKIGINGKFIKLAIKLVNYFKSSLRALVITIPEKDPLKIANKRLKAFYDTLPSSFTIIQAYSAASKLGLSERTVYYYLRKDIFKKVGQGCYVRTHFKE